MLLNVDSAFYLPLSIEEFLVTDGFCSSVFLQFRIGSLYSPGFTDTTRADQALVIQPSFFVDDQFLVVGKFIGFVQPNP